MISKPVQATYKTVICPDQESYCPDGSTCCMLPGGGYGCCPMPRAVCCSDHLHCCPHDSTCDLEHSTCRRREQNDLVEMKQKTPAASIASLTTKDICHDKTTMCLEGHRCCITVDAEWVCCRIHSTRKNSPALSGGQRNSIVQSPSDVMAR